MTFFNYCFIGSIVVFFMLEGYEIDRGKYRNISSFGFLVAVILSYAILTAIWPILLVIHLFEKLNWKLLLWKLYLLFFQIYEHGRKSAKKQ